MQDIAGSTVIAMALTLLAGFSVPSSAWAQEAQRCTGTFCDLYYGGSASSPAAPAAQPAAPTPVVVPTPSFSGISGITNFFSRPSAPPNAGAPAGQAAPSDSFVHFNGGGLVGGKPDQRCGGTLCDAYYGVTGAPAPSPSPAEATAPQSAPPAAVAPTGYVRPPGAPAPTKQREIVERVERQTPPACVGPARDPWQCFRK